MEEKEEAILFFTDWFNKLQQIRKEIISRYNNFYLVEYDVLNELKDNENYILELFSAFDLAYNYNWLLRLNSILNFIRPYGLIDVDLDFLLYLCIKTYQLLLEVESERNGNLRTATDYILKDIRPIDFKRFDKRKLDVIKLDFRDYFKNEKGVGLSGI